MTTTLRHPRYQLAADPVLRARFAAGGNSNAGGNGGNGKPGKGGKG